ncbi:SDR family oxidoreductase [Paraburkholderia sp. CNPSo 3272]|uniref:SDR family oxidoreductase n=1 Tax=Paraburkholderia sp. CNPSo 3272 TaxID=2940931 RepID=UPI00266038E7|nr:SDR family oxidoreductase [Paraburkholderia sp. CNPSo 3272]
MLWRRNICGPTFRKGELLYSPREAVQRPSGGDTAWKSDKAATANTRRGAFPAARWGEPDDLAGLVVFLASSAANYVHGHTLAVDGGWLAR